MIYRYQSWTCDVYRVYIFIDYIVCLIHAYLNLLTQTRHFLWASFNSRIRVNLFALFIEQTNILPQTFHKDHLCLQLKTYINIFIIVKITCTLLIISNKLLIICYSFTKWNTIICPICYCKQCCLRATYHSEECYYYSYQHNNEIISVMV